MAHIRQSRPYSGLDFQVKAVTPVDRLRVCWLKRSEDAQGTPTQSHISPGVLVYEDPIIPSSEAVRKRVPVNVPRQAGLGFTTKMPYY